MLNRFRSCALVAAAACTCAVLSTASAQSTITIFGQEYNVSRINYSDAIRLPRNNPLSPLVPFIESEGVQYIGENKILLSADDIADVATNIDDNWIVEVQLEEVDCQIVGITSWRKIFSQNPTAAGYDLNPTGVTFNPTASGFGGGGNVIASRGDGYLYAYSAQAGSLGTQLSFPIGTDCLAVPLTCGLPVDSRNSNMEDVSFAPINGGVFLAINQDRPTVEKWNATTGAFISDFPVGFAIPTALALADAKGVTFAAESEFLPPTLRGAGGVVIVSFDDNFPGLQAFDTDGNLLATEPLTVDGTNTGAPRLNVSDCIAGVLQIESLSFDPSTGRIFLNNQGALTFCNYLWVLTPTSYTCSACPVCPADYNQDGGVTGDDISAFFADFEAGSGCADTNVDGGITGDDIATFFIAFEAGGC